MSKPVNPCRYCQNPKKDVHKCYEMCCIGFSRFVPKPNTPKSVLIKVEETHEDYIGW